MSQRQRTEAGLPHELAFLPPGLEVVLSNEEQVLQSGKETVQAEPEAICQEDKEAFSQTDKEVSNSAVEAKGPPKSSDELIRHKRICGLKYKVFWALLVAFGLIIALAVGLGAGLGSRRSKASPADDSIGNSESNSTEDSADDVADDGAGDSATLNASNTFVELLKNGTSGAVVDQEDSERRYTTAMVRELRLYNPNKHFLIYHDPNSSIEVDVNAQYARTKLDLGLGFSQDYEMYIFSYGNFTLAGPADFDNVCWDGMATRRGKRVTFEDRTNWSNQAIFNDTSLPPGIARPPPPEPPVLPPSKPARLNPSNQDGYHFLDCSGPNDTVSSGAAYYVQLQPGRNTDQLPNDYVNVTENSYADWEVPDAAMYQDSNVSLYWAVFGGADTHAVDSLVGVAEGRPDHKFWMYRDSGDVLYEVDGWTCRSMYWAY